MSQVLSLFCNKLSIIGSQLSNAGSWYSIETHCHRQMIQITMLIKDRNIQLLPSGTVERQRHSHWQPSHLWWGPKTRNLCSLQHPLLFAKIKLNYKRGIHIIYIQVQLTFNCPVPCLDIKHNTFCYENGIEHNCFFLSHLQIVIEFCATF